MVACAVLCGNHRAILLGLLSWMVLLVRLGTVLHLGADQLGCPAQTAGLFALQVEVAGDRLSALGSNSDSARDPLLASRQESWLQRLWSSPRNAAALSVLV